jgi:transposase
MDEHRGREIAPWHMIQHLLNQGWSQSRIARHFGVTRQAVSLTVRKYGQRSTEQVVLEDHFPWKVPAEQTQTSPYKRMRSHGKFAVTAGEGMKDDELDRLFKWHQKLRDENVVLEFDPNIPPVPGVSNKGGFAYRKRRKSDKGLIIRVNKDHTNLTKPGEDIWRLPPPG